jgi:hypothetical protein
VTVSLSPPVRIVALLGLVAALALAGGFMLLGRSSDAAAPKPIVIKHHPFGPGATKKAPAAKPAATSTPAVKPASKAALRPAPAVHKAAAKPAAELAALAAGLPAPVAKALGRAPVVVVELTDPQSEVDGIAYAEAGAGAALAGVPFVPLNVLSQRDVGKLTEQFGSTLPEPGLLVYARPARLAVRIDGFVDKETVAQAAQNVLRGG